MVGEQTIASLAAVSDQGNAAGLGKKITKQSCVEFDTQQSGVRDLLSLTESLTVVEEEQPIAWQHRTRT